MRQGTQLQKGGESAGGGCFEGCVERRGALMCWAAVLQAANERLCLCLRAMLPLQCVHTASYLHHWFLLPSSHTTRSVLLIQQPQSIELLYLRAICHHALGYVRKAVADYEACMHVPARPKEDGPLAEEAQ